MTVQGLFADPLVQWCSFINLQGAPTAVDVGRFQLPHVSIAGNLLLMAFTHGQAAPDPVAGVTDDTGTSWTRELLATDSTSGDHYVVFYRLNNPGGIREIRVTFTTASAFFMGGGYGEFWGVASATAIDGTTAHSEQVAAPNLKTASAVTTTQDGDLVFTFAFSRGTWTNAGYAAFTPDTGQQFLSTDSRNGFVAMYGIQAKAGAINPKITAPGTDPFDVVTVAFKRDVTKGAQADANASPRCRRVLWYDVDKAGSLTFTVQVPTSGNLLAANWCGDEFSSITDNFGNAFVHPPHVIAASQVAGQQQWFWRLGGSGNASTCSQVALKTTDATSDTLVFFDIEYGPGLEFDKTATAKGVQSSGGTLVTDTIAPSRAGGVMLAATMINAGTLQKFTSAFAAVQPFADAFDGNSTRWSEDDGYGIYLPADTSSVTPTYHNSRETGTGVADWVSYSISFVPRMSTHGRLAPQLRAG